MKSLSAKYPFEILIVEDNFINQTLIRKLFEILGYKTDLVVNGVEAWKAVERKKYDLVFMDIKMPMLSGYEAIRKIKKMKPLLPVIAITAYANSSDRKNAITMGFDEYFSKPLDKKLFLEFVKKFFEGNKGNTDSLKSGRVLLM